MHGQPYRKGTARKGAIINSFNKEDASQKGMFSSFLSNVVKNEKKRTNGRAPDWSSHQLWVPAPLKRLHLVILIRIFIVKNDYELDLRLIDI